MGSKLKSQKGATYLVVVPLVTVSEVTGWCRSVTTAGLHDSHGIYDRGYIHEGLSLRPCVVGSGNVAIGQLDLSVTVVIERCDPAVTV